MERLRASLAGRRSGAALLASVVFSVAVFPFVARAESDPVEVEVGIFPFPPEMVVSEGRPPTGFAIEVLDEVAARAGLTVHYRRFDSGGEATAALRSGGVDLIPSLGDIERRRRNFGFSQPLGAIPIVLFVRKGETGVGSLSDLDGRLVAVVEGNAGDDLVAGRDDVTVSRLPTLDEGLFALVSGAADALIYPEYMALAEARRLGVDDVIRVTGRPLSQVSRAMAVRRGDTGLLRRLNAGIAATLGTPGYRDLLERWYGGPPPYWTSSRVGVLLGALLLLTVVSLVAWRFRTLTVANRALAEKEAELRQSEAALIRAERLAGIGHWEWDLASGSIRWSPGMFRLLGYEGGAWGYVPLEKPLERVHPDDLTMVRGNIERFLETGVSTLTQYRVLLPGGETRTMLQSEPEVRTGPDGRPLSAFGLLLDVTERARAEASLGLSQERLAAQYQSFPVPTYTWRILGDDLELVSWNRAGSDYTRGRIAELAGVRASELYADSPEILADLRECARAPGHLIEREIDYHVRVLGVTRRIRVTYAPVSADEVSVFSEDITERYEAERALRHSQRTLAEAQRIAHLGNWEWDLSTDAVSVSDEVYEMFGRAPGDMEASRESLIRLVPEEDRPRVRAAAEVALEGGNYDVDHRVQLPSGETRFVHTAGRVHFDDAGRPARMVGTIQDVTELRTTEAALRASLAEKTVLLREIHHRVKNNLQVISSLLYMQGRQRDVPGVREVLDESRSRVRAMALVHETLYQSGNLGSVAFDEYLQRMLDGVWKTHQVPGIATHVKASGPPIDLELAVPLGLVTNELVTNALKHAFPEGRGGEVRVSFEGGEDGSFVLVVADDGVGMPDAVDVRRVDSLGLKLVGLLAGQVDAALQVESSPGAVFTLSRPAPPRDG